MYSNIIFGAQLHRMTGDVPETGLANGKMPDMPVTNKEFTTQPANKKRVPLYAREPWLRGPAAFIQPPQPEFAPAIPLTGTGTCTLPTTVEILKAFFRDAVSQTVFQEKMVTRADHPVIARLRALHAVCEECPLWSLADDRVRPEMRRSAVRDWITIRLNWALHKKAAVKAEYLKLMALVSTMSYNNNAAFHHNVPASQQPLEPHSKTSIEAFIERLRAEVFEAGSAVRDGVTEIPNRPNHSSHAFVTSDRFNADLPTSAVLTHHRYWAVYYMELLDRFIAAHDEAIHTGLLAGDAPGAKPLPRIHVATKRQPFDAAYATWDWTPLAGHRGSCAILKLCYPDNPVFQQTFYELYTHYARFPGSPTAAWMRARAESIARRWDSAPLLPLDLIADAPWALPAPFAPGSHFLWTFFVVVGELDRLKHALTSAERPPAFFKDDPARREVEVDFRLKQLQVRLTGFLATSRWLLTRIILDRVTAIDDASVPSHLVHYPYEDVDFDGDLDMPDVSRLLHKLNFWRFANTEAKTNPVLNVYQKALPFHSHARVLSDVFEKAIHQGGEAMATLAQLWAMATGLGVLAQLPPPRQDKAFVRMHRPAFAGMAKVDWALLQTPRQLFNFIHMTKSKVLIYMSRELLVNAVAKCHPYREHQLFDWTQLERNTCEIGNLIRQHLEHHRFWLLPPHNQARRRLEDTISSAFEKRFKILLFNHQDFPHKLQSHFYSAHIDHLDKIVGLVVKLANDPTNREHLYALQLVRCDIPENVRTVLWQTMLGMRSDIDIWPIVRQWLADADLLLVYQLQTEYDHFASKAKFEALVSKLSLSAFTMLYFLVQVQTTLASIKLVAIPQAQAQAVHEAMRGAKHRLFPGQPLQDSAYDVHYSLCCSKVLTLTRHNSYGSRHLSFNRTSHALVCCQKRSKKKRRSGGDEDGDDDDDDGDGEDDDDGCHGDDIDDGDDDEEEDGDEEAGSEAAARTKRLVRTIMNMSVGKSGSIAEYNDLSLKERRKIVRRLDKVMNPVTCQNRPPVLTINLRGFKLIVGSREETAVTYLHCPECAGLHVYSNRHYNGGLGYMCADCVARLWQPAPALQRRLFCAYCGKQHFRDVECGLTPTLAHDVFDVQRPVRLVHFCSLDFPRHGGDYVHPRALNLDRRSRTLFLDTYMKRHNNIMRQNSKAMFPFQSTVDNVRDGVPKGRNGFTWARFGQRLDRIPHPIDTWWPPQAQAPRKEE